MSKLIADMKSVSEFLNDILDAIEGKDFLKAMTDAAPWWAGALGQAASESLPLVGFVLKYAKKLSTEDDPEKQAYTACTLAYNRAIEQALRARSQQLKSKVIAQKVDQLIKIEIPKDIDMQDFTFDKSALSHTFILESDVVFRDFSLVIGIDKNTINTLINVIHQRFLANLRLLLSHPKTCENFDAFSKLLTFQMEDYKARKAIEDHKQYQWWLFNEAPVFGQEPFALTHIYTETHCGVLTWSEICGSKRKPHEQQSENRTEDRESLYPFSEVDSQRTDILQTILNFIANDEFNEPIIIQGVAGAGKSSLTLRLTSELIDYGFSPIRILLRDLDIDRGLIESLPNAIRFGEKGFKSYGVNPQFDQKWFEHLLQSTEFIIYGSKEVHLSPYVLIFDGWDEISTGATQGFKDDIDRVLTEIRSLFISYRGNRPPIRVIVTGRPTVDVTKTRLLQSNTPILTIRPFDPSQLDSFIDQVLEARQSQPLISIDKKDQRESSGLSKKTISKNWFADVIESYRIGFDAMKNEHLTGNVYAQPMGSMAVLGMPLLAHLALRLMLDLDSPEQLQALVKTPTTLYRALIDMTYQKGGKPETADIKIDHMYRITGDDLRVLLWSTAEAITATGCEEISREELKLRLRWNDEKLKQIVNNSTEDNVLAGLIIGFFFKEGTEEQGCEFLHKSFREYLFAEGIIELLKLYGSDNRVINAYSKEGFSERDVYWEDFEDEESLHHMSIRDPRYDFTHRLASAFSTKWASPEVKEHLKELIIWEVERAGDKPSVQWPGIPTKSISIKQWGFVRDGLADVWDWWAEGVLLRPRPKLSREHGTPEFSEPYIVRLTKSCSPRDPRVWKGKTLPDVVRTITVDSRLGDAFFHLTAVTHAELFLSSWKRLTKKQIKVNVYELEFRQRRRYQRAIDIDDIVLARFSPSGEDTRYFKNFCARINSAGFRPEGTFPSCTFGRFLFLQGVDLQLVDFSYADYNFSDLRNADMRAGRFSGAKFRETNFTAAKIDKQYLDQASDLVGIIGVK